MSHRRVLIGVIALGIVALVLPGVGRGQQVESLLATAKDQMAGRRYQEAVETLQRVAREAGPGEAAAEARFLAGQASLLGRRPEEAIRFWLELLEQRPNSPYARKARFLIADAYVALHQFDRAVDIVRREATDLAGTARRIEIAGLYLDLGILYYRGQEVGREGDPLDPRRLVRDFGRALPFLEQARRIHGTARDAPPLRAGDPPIEAATLDHMIARCKAELSQHGPAVDEWQALFRDHPGAAVESEALLACARSLILLGRRDEARSLLQRVIDEHTDAPEAPAAQRLLGDSYDPVNTSDPSARRAGIAAWARFIERYPDHADVTAVWFDKGRAEMAGGEMDRAVETLRALVEAHADDPRAPEALFAMGNARLQQSRFDDARTLWDELMRRFPNHELWARAKDARIDALLTAGDYLRSLDRQDEARAQWERLIAENPADGRAPVAQMRIAESLALQSRFEEAIAAYEVVASRYVRSEQAPDAQWRIAQHIETNIGALPRAIRAYEALIQRFPQSWQARQAQAHLQELREKRLVMRTPRIFDTGTGAHVHLSLRNVRHLDLRAYRLDLEDFFRRRNTAGGIFDLAVDIVEPEASWAYEVPDYEAYRTFEVDPALPMTEPGAYVVTAIEDEFRAETLVILSDLAIVTRAAPGQILVFARNQRTGEAMPGTEVIVSDGGQIIFEGTTGADGVLLADDPDLTPWRGLQILARKENHFAASGFGLTGGAAGFGYTEKGYIYTDRPVYRPGQTVYFRGIIRRVEEGRYVAPASQRCEVSIRDARGVLVHEEAGTLDAYGAYAGDFVLGAEPAIGEYTATFRVRETDYAGTFHVEAYQKPEMLIAIQAAQPTYLEGEEVTARLSAEFTSGGAVGDAPVTWYVWRTPYAFDRTRYERFAWFFAEREAAPEGGGELVANGQGRTAADGTFEIHFATREVGGDSSYVVIAEVQGPTRRTARGAASIYVTRDGFYVIVQVDRNVYRPGDRVTAFVTSVDARHTGQAIQGEMVLYRGSQAQGLSIVRTQPLATGEDGRAESTLTVDEPGDYRVAWRAADRRDRLIEGWAPVYVAGERRDLADEALLIADREVYRQGDTAEVLVNSPVSPVRALLTYEGERILGYRIVALDRQSNTLQIPMEERFSPNIFLHIAIPGPERLYEAEDEVMIFRYLDIQASFSVAETRPDGTVVLRITTTDQSGRPVQAEVSVAVVDEAVYAIRPDATAAIKPFFYDQRRTQAVAASSSWAFAYEGQTERRSAAALAELARRQLDEAAREYQGRNRAEAQFATSEMPPPAAPMLEPMANATTAASGEAGGRGGMYAFGEEEANGPISRLAMDGFADAAGSLDRLDAFRGPMNPAGFGIWGAPPQVTYAEARLRRNFQDTALWRSDVVTAADGTASVEVHVPDNLTTWRATIRGSSTGALFGEGEARVRTAQPIVVEIGAPRFLVQRDRSEVAAIVHNRGDREVPLAVELQAENGIRAEGTRTQIRVPARGVLRTDWPIQATGQGPATVTARALGQEFSDAETRPIPALPHGVREVRAWSGRLGGATPFAFDLPTDRVAGTERVEIRLVPAVSTEVVDALAFLDTYPYGCVEQTLNRFLPAVVALEALRNLGVLDLARQDEAVEHARAGLARLAAIQNPDGGWGWWPDRPSHPYITAYVLAGLERCRMAGVAPDPSMLARARQAARNLLSQTGEDADRRAWLVHALALSGNAAADDVSRALRARDEMTTLGRAILAIGLAGAQRQYSADPLLAAIRAAAVTEGDRVHWEAGAPHGWSSSDGETTAYAVMALLAYTPDDRLIEPAIRWLRDQRTSTFWRSTKETAAIVTALVRYLGNRGVSALNARIRVNLNGRQYAETEIRQGRIDEARRVLVIGPQDLANGRNTVRVEGEGAGDLHLSISATWVRDVEGITADGTVVRVERKLVRYIPQTGEGEVPGWSIVRAEDRPDWRAEAALAEVYAGQRLTCKLAITLTEALDFVVIEDAIPAGCEVDSEGATGGFDRMEPRDTGVSFFFTHLEPGTTVISYNLRAFAPGDYHVLPAYAGPMYEPEVRGRSTELRLRVVDPEGGQIAAPEPTPDEIYARIQRLQQDGRHQDARPLIERLLAATYRLRQDVKEDLRLRLLRATLALSDHAAAVRAFEALRDENPRAANLSMDEWLALAGAYGQVREYEASLLHYGRVLGDLAARDLAVADAYRSLGRELPAQDYIFSTLRLYPDADAIITAGYQVARRYYDLDRPPDEARIRGYRQDVPPKMYEEAYAALKEFVAYHPESAWNDDAQYYATLSAYRAGRYEVAAGEAQRFVERYAGSDFFDDALYYLALARFEAGQYDRALEAGNALLAYRIPVRQGVTEPSPYVPAIQHLFGRIYHLRGDLDRAVEQYRLVADRVADARSTLEFLTAEGLEVPAVTRIRPDAGQGAARYAHPAVSIRYRNLADLTLRIYRVDLFMLFAERPDLSRVESVDLTGIAPDAESTATLRGRRYQWNEEAVPLPVTETGVYLVVVKSGNHQTSSIVMLSDLDLRVTREGGVARVYATLASTGAPASRAYVKISDGATIAAEGRTDERGIFEGRNVGGSASVVAEREGHFALWRQGQD